VPIADVIDPGVDGDFYTFNGTAGTDIRVNVNGWADLMDPVIEIRDPNGSVLVDGVADGAACTDRCSFSVDLTPTLSGTYSLLIYDRVTNEVGNYEISLWCLHGPCDSDADGIADGTYPPVSETTASVLAYGFPAMDMVSPPVDGDFFIFGAAATTLIRINVLANADLMDPVIEVRDPNGTLLVNGSADGAACTDRCSFTVDLAPAISGTYSLVVYDNGTNESGAYEIGLQCLAGACSDAVAVCGDNCVDVFNPDQRDSDGDGYGDLCDSDLNNDGDSNTLDLNLYKQAHRTVCGDPNYTADADFNADCRINTIDLNIFKGLYRNPPGRSCIAP
jgi:hypothetical protein